MKFTPAPGTYIAEEIKDDSQLKLSTKKTRLLKGKVIAVGEMETTDFGIMILPQVKVGDIVYFLSYEGSYDEFYLNHKHYWCVLRKDHRVIIKDDK